MQSVNFDIDDTFFENIYVRIDSLDDKAMNDMVKLERLVELGYDTELLREKFYLDLINPEYNLQAKEWEVFLRKNGYIK